MPEVRLEGLVRRHRGPVGVGVTALAGLTLTVVEGELLVLLGPSGAGKTTALRVIAGLEEPDAGRVWIGGRDMAGIAPLGRGVAMVFQDHPLFPGLSVAENMGIGLRLGGRSRAEEHRRVRDMAERLGLEGVLGREPGTLSGGERQRVALGAALAGLERGVVLLDEPLAQLDGPLRCRLRGEIRRAQRELGQTTIHVTHDQAEAMAMADRVAVVRAGELQQVGRPLEVYRRPANLFVAEFLGAPGMNLVRGWLERGTVGGVMRVAGGGEIRLGARGCPEGLGEGPWVFGVRPEGLRRVVAGGGGAAGCCAEGIVEGMEPFGHETVLEVRVGGIRLRVREDPRGEVGVGERVALEMTGGGVAWFDGTTGEWRA